jgi:hypothetical protein
MIASSLRQPRMHKFSGKRYPCPECGSSDGLAYADGRTDTGKCHSCKAWIEPKRENFWRYSNGILRTKQGNTINTLTFSRPQKVQESKDDKVIPTNEIAPSFDYLWRCRECDSLEERMAIREIENGLSPIEAEHEAGVIGILSTNPNTLMLKIIEEELTLLRRMSPFAATITELTRPTILSEWYVGLSADRAIIFWHVDRNGRFRNAKKIWFKDDFHRDKSRKPHFIYAGFPIPLFGEWQLNGSDKKVIIVESEKTAIVASCHAPQYTWLACGGESGLTAYKARALQGKDCLIFFDCDPDRNKVMECAESAAQNIRAAGGKASVIDQYARFPGHNEGWDAADQIYSELILGLK